MDDKRKLQTGEPVQVTVLLECEAAAAGTVANSLNGNIELLVGKPAPLGAAVKVDGGDMLFLGEIYSCRPEGGKFTIGVELQHALYNTAELARLAKRILDEDERRL
jgi:hypothetical protein